MTIKIMTASQRMARPNKINIIIAGPSGVGKTSLIRSLPPETTLVVDYESGALALQDWGGDLMDVRQTALAVGVDPWELSRALACLLCGPDPADLNGPYSRQAYDAYRAKLGEPDALFGKYEYVVFDSLSVASRHAFAWAKRQPDAFSDKTGKPDTRGAYGLLGQEMVRWLTTIQHIPGKSVFAMSILDRLVDDLGRVTWALQIEGGKTGRELPGIFDQILTLQNFYREDGTAYRAFVTQQQNPDGYPAKDRSGRLDPIEPPDLGALLRKIRAANGTPFALTTTLPPTPAAA